MNPWARIGAFTPRSRTRALPEPSSPDTAHFPGPDLNAAEGRFELVGDLSWMSNGGQERATERRGATVHPVDATAGAWDADRAATHLKALPW